MDSFRTVPGWGGGQPLYPQLASKGLKLTARKPCTYQQKFMDSASHLMTTALTKTLIIPIYMYSIMIFFGYYCTYITAQHAEWQCERDNILISFHPWTNTFQQFGLSSDVQPLFAVKVLEDQPEMEDHLGVANGERVLVLLLKHENLPDSLYLVEKEDGTSKWSHTYNAHTTQF